MNYQKRKVKIVCTLGPASESLEQISALVDAGMDVARLNFSHGSHAFHAQLIQRIRQVAQKKCKPIGILQDLQGPKLRVGTLPTSGVRLHPGDSLLLFPEGNPPESSTGHILIPISAEIAKTVAIDAQKGRKILFDDGKMVTQIQKISGFEMIVEVEVGGVLFSHKGMNLPGTPLSLSCLTEKDYQDLHFGVSQGVDAVALSFVRTAQDVRELKMQLRTMTAHPPWVVPKLERAEGIENHEAILEVSDGLLIARGDMAVEIGAERVPVIQKKLIAACNQLGVPVITATQMLESMIAAPIPTRAEANDVANAVFDGTDAVMLSAETASGQYPMQAVETMTRVILEAECHSVYSRHADTFWVPGSVVDAVEKSAAQIADQVGAVAIVCLTHSGMAARVLAKYRPETNIVALMNHERMLRRLAFVWGVRGEIVEGISSTDDLFAPVENLLISKGWAAPGDRVVVTAGIPTLKRGTTNMVQVYTLSS